MPVPCPSVPAPRSPAPNPGEEEAAPVLLALPGLGTATAATHQRRLLWALAWGLALLLGLGAWMLERSERGAQQLRATGQALMQSERLAKSVAQALLGRAQAFPEVQDSAALLVRQLQALAQGDAGLAVAALGPRFGPLPQDLNGLAERAQAHAQVVIAQQQGLTQVGEALRTVNRQASEWLEATEAIFAHQLQARAPAAELAAAARLMVLSQRLGKSANDILTPQGVSPEAVFLLGKDLVSFQDLVQGLQHGQPESGLRPARDPALRAMLVDLAAQFARVHTQAEPVLGQLPGLVAAREAQDSLVAGSGALRQSLDGLQGRLSRETTWGMATWLVLGGLGTGVLWCGLGIGQVLLRDSRARAAAAHQARQAQATAMRRLQAELQAVAEGDLTREASAQADDTRVIAAAVNATVRALRELVARVQAAAAQVVDTAAEVNAAAARQQATAASQLQDIQASGQAVLGMAERIGQVAQQARGSVAVARESRQAAADGRQSVQQAMDGMRAIQGQMQDSAQRIQRLGESSQQIGEITAMIADLTAQTQVLAINAAIQAASAGEAGRGFTVVAEEVQRLAERSADATRQIAQLVQAIQGDTRAAVVAMARSTQVVAEGGQLSDRAGMALGEMERVCQTLAELVEQVSVLAQDDAAQAQDMAARIAQWMARTAQSSEDSRATATQVRALSQMAQALRTSVARFTLHKEAS